FNRANPDNALEYPCERYNKAEEMLQAITQESDLNVDYFRSILESVHQEGIFSTTLYSNIFDLKNRILYLYHWHQYEEVVVINVDEALAEGKKLARISDLFSADTVRSASREYIGFIFLLCFSTIAGTVLTIAMIRYIKRGKWRRTVGKKG
ncbi:MAG: hypothetical protein KDC44_12475, partial [Phaeodactylibacter sp.]|nr:hypothetical protein [Phaeodactylibacter sp.]